VQHPLARALLRTPLLPPYAGDTERERREGSRLELEVARADGEGCGVRGQAVGERKRNAEDRDGSRGAPGGVAATLSIPSVRRRAFLCAVRVDPEH